MNQRHRIRVATTAALLCLTALAGTAWADLNTQARAIIDAADLPQTAYSLYAVDLESNLPLLSINPDDPMMPASNMKLVTTAAAVRVLGPDFVFRTELRLIPAQEGDDAHGPFLVIRGDGDPSLGDRDLLLKHNLDQEALLQLWVEAVKKTGLKEFDRLVVDDRVFDQTFIPPNKAWPADQLTRHYCAQVTGLNFNDNCLDLYPEPTKPGDSPRVTILPAAPFLSVTNTAVTVSRTAATTTGDTFWASRRAQTNDLTYFGKVQSRYTDAVQLPIDDPPMFFGRLIKDRLRAAGITVRTVERASPDERLADGKTLHAIQTTLDEVLARCNKDSENLFAECLFKRMGRKDTGQPGSWENGAAAVRKVLGPVLGARVKDITFADGSGLSREDRVTAHILTDILRLTYLDPQVGPVFTQSLSVGGKDGTLHKRFVGGEFKGFKGQVLGKSGYINPEGKFGVATLSGLLILPDTTHKNGRRIVVFSLLFNGFKPPVGLGKLHDVQDRLVHLLLEHESRQPAATQEK